MNNNPKHKPKSGQVVDNNNKRVLYTAINVHCHQHNGIIVRDQSGRTREYAALTYENFSVRARVRKTSRPASRKTFEKTLKKNSLRQLRNRTVKKSALQTSSDPRMNVGEVIRKIHCFILMQLVTSLWLEEPLLWLYKFTVNKLCFWSVTACEIWLFLLIDRLYFASFEF